MKQDTTGPLDKGGDWPSRDLSPLTEEADIRDQLAQSRAAAEDIARLCAKASNLIALTRASH
jgi:hypothetical protein